MTEKHPGGRPLKFKTAKELQSKIDDFFDQCSINEDIPTITGLAVALKTNRQTLVNYSQKEQFVDTINGAKAKIEAGIQQLALKGLSNPALSIFTLKNNYGWKDKTEVEQDTVLSIRGSLETRVAKAKSYFDDIENS